MTSLVTLLTGLLGLVGIIGVGRLLLRPLGTFPLHWYVSLSTLAGLAASSLIVQLLAMAGIDRIGYIVAGAAVVAIGLGGHAVSGRRWTATVLPPKGPARTAACLLFVIPLIILVLISVAPSSKIDEIHYHMLIGRRILNDNGVRIYQLPFEAAILPQMGYQIFETVFHATQTIDAGNVLSLGFFMALAFMLYGVVTEASGSSHGGLAAALAAATGLFPAVWYVTAGAHALGDLAMFTSIAALFFPGSLSPDARVPDDLGDRSIYKRAFACILGAACAASTKVSLVPVGLVITALAVLQAPARARGRTALLAMALWLLSLGPLVSWTYVHTHSPFGAAFAEWFGGSTYGAATLQAIAAARSGNRYSAGEVVTTLAEFLNGMSIGLIVAGLWASFSKFKQLFALIGLVIFQLGVIALLLPHDFRFLGGLQYGLLAAGAISLARWWPMLVASRWVGPLLLCLLGPWLAAEIYYAFPFAEVSLGAMGRAAYFERYVAFSDDYRALDGLLPKDSVLYVPYDRIPAVYAPRPVIFDLADWDGRSPLFRFSSGTGGQPDLAPARERAAGLDCGEIIYENASAVTFAYRAPRRVNDRGDLRVQRCVARPQPSMARGG